MNKPFSWFSVSFLFGLVCLAALSVSATFLIDRAIFRKQTDGKDRETLEVLKNDQVLSKNAELENSLQKLEDEYGNLEARYKELAASFALARQKAGAKSVGAPSEPPPVEQPIVREGEFAMELAIAFNLISNQDEMAGESSLSSIHIMPRNGWISDYPMTPDIIAEIRESVAAAASSGDLQLSEADAVSLVDNVSIATNLPVKADYDPGSEPGQSADATAPAAPEYLQPSDIEDYYDDSKPPVVTYYPPPQEYVSLYTWVPSPFWWEGFRFGGYFILVDFDRRHRHHPVTNHIKDTNGGVTRIKAITRTDAAAVPQGGTSENTAKSADEAGPHDLTSSGSERSAGHAAGAASTGRAGPVWDRKPAASNPGLNTGARQRPHEIRAFEGGQPPRFTAPAGEYRGTAAGFPAMGSAGAGARESRSSGSSGTGNGYGTGIGKK